MAFKIFTNAVDAYDGQSIAINSDKIISVIEREKDDITVTVLYAGPELFWEVKEDYLEVINSLNEAA